MRIIYSMSLFILLHFFFYLRRFCFPFWDKVMIRYTCQNNWKWEHNAHIHTQRMELLFWNNLHFRICVYVSDFSIHKIVWMKAKGHTNLQLHFSYYALDLFIFWSKFSPCFIFHILINKIFWLLLFWLQSSLLFLVVAVSVVFFFHRKIIMLYSFSKKRDLNWQCNNYMAQVCVEWSA